MRLRLIYPTYFIYSNKKLNLACKLEYYSQQYSSSILVKHARDFGSSMLMVNLFTLLSITAYDSGPKSIPNEAAALATYLLVCIHPAFSSSALLWSSSASQLANRFSGVCCSGDK